ncbi:MAG TPA: hypothetical protein VFP98_00895, partial [Candidatus Polarisedimenticolia bacterium]|nr:hypothetical protein [Candidatus Polarisedimenticolia bacterium]
RTGPAVDGGGRARATQATVRSGGVLRTATALVMAGAAIAAGSCAGWAPPLRAGDPAMHAALRAGRVVWSGRDGITLARGDGSGARLLVAAGAIGQRAALFTPCLAPAGDRLIFFSLVELDVRDSTGRDLTLHLLRLDADRITDWQQIRLERISPPPGGGRQDVFAVAAAAWSTDGERFAVALDRSEASGGDSVAIFDKEGVPTALYALGGRALPRVGGLSILPGDGDLILDLEPEGGIGEPVVARLRVPPPGGGTTALTAIGPGLNPRLSPDGTRIAVVAPPDAGRDLALLDLEGREIRRYTRPAGRALSRPFWSADGRFLYYHSLGSTGPLGLMETPFLRCLDTASGSVWDLARIE